jgi:glycosyltransferase involved in cell wall biosynthesis
MNKPKSSQAVKLLALTTAGYFPPFLDDIDELHKSGEAPRVWLLEIAATVTILDQRFLTNPSKWRRNLYRIIPMPIAHALEAFRVRRDYDAIFAWGAESVALPLALLLKLARQRIPFVALFGWVSPPKKSWLLRLAHSHIAKLIIPPSSQREFAIEHLHIPKAKITSVPWCVDEQFWKFQSNGTFDVICSAGREMRDFETLIKALADTDIPCHIAGALVHGKNDRWRQTVGDSGGLIKLPDNVTVGSMSPIELRRLYARSRFVVLPLHHSDTDNGISCMLEAWSVGRTVICSQVDGQRDALQHGRNGLFVPVGDAEALRKAILDLWDRPDESVRMGFEGRRSVEENYRLDRFVKEISDVIRDSIS